MEPDVIETHLKHRQALLRHVMIYVPSGIVATALLLYSLTLLPQSIVGVVILAAFGFAVNVEAISALRDLRARPVVTEGRIDRKWSKARFAFFGRVHYLLVDKKLFEVGPIGGAELQLGDQVRVEHWPHSNTLVSIARLASAPPK